MSKWSPESKDFEHYYNSFGNVEFYLFYKIRFEKLGKLVYHNSLRFNWVFKCIVNNINSNYRVERLFVINWKIIFQKLLVF